MIPGVKNAPIAQRREGTAVVGFADGVLVGDRLRPGLSFVRRARDPQIAMIDSAVDDDEVSGGCPGQRRMDMTSHMLRDTHRWRERSGANLSGQ